MPDSGQRPRQGNGVWNPYADRTPSVDRTPPKQDPRDRFFTQVQAGNEYEYQREMAAQQDRRARSREIAAQ